MIILAAGFSSRMGVLKPLLPVGDRPAVLHNISSAYALGIRDVIVVTGNRSGEIESVLRENAPEVRHIRNENFTAGMFSSIIAGVRGLPRDIDGFFLLPADHCAVAQETFLTLIDIFKSSGAETIIRPKYGDKRGHPPLIPSKFIEPLLSYNREDGMRGFLNTCPFTAVLTEDRGVILDMDTPSDYADLLRYMGLPTYPDTAKCVELLARYGTPSAVIEHCEQVERVAQAIAERLVHAGLPIDRQLLSAVCLLHDILRAEPNHAQEGMKLLLREGYPDAALPVGTHMDDDGNFVGGITESELLFLADKLCRHGKVTPIEVTMARQRVKFENNPAALESATKRMNRARAILETLRARYGIEFDDIRQSIHCAG